MGDNERPLSSKHPNQSDRTSTVRSQTESQNQSEEPTTRSALEVRDQRSTNVPTTSDRMESIRTTLNTFFARLSINSERREEQPSDKFIKELTFDGLMKHWKENGFKNIITMVGAGISTSAGIPDFRSPGTGLYDNLKQYNLSNPTDIFELDYFMENPKPFFTLAKELYPGTFIPTPAHYFVRLLNEKGLLVRHYSQNIDCLERVAGIPEEKLVEAHGTFHTNHCVECRKSYTKEWMKEIIFNDELPLCDDCGSLVKPDIVFFGENLPEKFYSMPSEDFAECDLLIIMGTSLEVYPFASLVDHAGARCIRLLINRTKIDAIGSEPNTSDITFMGDCDAGVWQITDAMGWTDELKELIKNETSQFEKPAKPKPHAERKKSTKSSTKL